MTIQALPAFYNFQYVDKEGNMTSASYLFNDQTFQTLNAVVNLLNMITTTIINQGNVTVNGLNPPSFTTAQINALFLLDTVPVGTIWYDSDMDVLKFKGAAAVQTITSV